MSNKMRRTPLLAVVGLLLWVVPADAQTARVLILDPVTFAPTAGGYVLLVDDTGAEIARSLNAGDGLLAITAPTGGRYRLASVRVGYHTSYSEPFDIEDGQAVDLTIDLAHERVDLAAVADADACLPADAPKVELVWQETKKVLLAANWNGRDGLDYYSIMYDRDVDPEGLFVFGEQTNVTRGLVMQSDADAANQPFIVDRSDGGITYNPPTIGLLLSDRFAASYCFRVKTDDQSVTLSFEPRVETENPDVAGSFVLDVESGHLQSLDYRFLNVPLGIGGYQAGGQFAFMPGPSGRWLANEWEMRTPTVASDDDGQPALAGIRRVGGVVAAIARGEDVLYSAPLAELTGFVLDSAGATAVAGAEVRLVGTDYSATTDERGRFRITGPLDGEYAVTFTHVQFDRDGLFTRDTTVVLGIGRDVTLSLQPYGGEDYLRGLIGGGGQTRRARWSSGRPTDTRYIITHEEIEAAKDEDAFSLVSRIRGQWMRNRGAQSFSGFVAVPVAFRNGKYLGPLSVLGSILLENVEEIWYFDRDDARHRYGNRYAGAVIDVIDRR